MAEVGFSTRWSGRLVRVVVGCGCAQLLLVGGISGCTGDGEPLTIGLPTDTAVKGNLVQSLGNAAFISFETIDTRVSGNTIVGGTFAISLNEDVGADVVDNQISGSTFSIIVFDSMGDAKIAGNQMSGHGFGILLDNTSGYDVTDNVFLTPGQVVDVFLETTTSDNRVVVPIGTNVTDLGVGNEVTFE